MKERKVDFGVPFPANEQAAEVAQPGNGAFDDPASFVASQRPSILQSRPSASGTMRANDFDSFVAHPQTQPIGVVSPIQDQPPGFAQSSSQTPLSDAYLLPGVFDQRDLRGRRRRHGHSQRNTRAVCHHHPLRTLSTLGFSDTFAPFFAGEKLASVKHSSQSRYCLSWSSSSRARQARSQAPCSPQSRSLRQHVLDDGYRSGRSLHRAPLRSTQRIPSKQRRLPIGFGPPRGEAWGGGSSFSIFCHCVSLSSSTFLAIDRLLPMTSRTPIEAGRKSLQIAFN